MSRQCNEPWVNSSSASKKTLIAAEQETQRVKDMRFAYRLWSFTIDPRNLVFIDETGIHLAMIRLYGRAPIGERLYDSEAPDNGGKNISLIGGMSLDGLIATLSVVGSVNTGVFLFYVQEILTGLVCSLWFIHLITAVKDQEATPNR